jgi:HEAT repeat protein
LLSAAPKVVRALTHDTDPPVRVAAARSLGRLGLPDDVQPLTEALGDEQAIELRVAAADALGKIGGRDAVAALLPLLSSAEHDLARAAGYALASCGVIGVTALSDATHDPASAPHALEALARLELRSPRRPGTLAA